MANGTKKVLIIPSDMIERICKNGHSFTMNIFMMVASINRLEFSHE